MSWYKEAVFYHIYPYGFLDCIEINDLNKEPVSRILNIIDIIPHLKEMNINAVYFGPVFESVFHGYDTIDYQIIDRRLGTNADFAKVCDELHKNGIKVVIDGVFNHVGRDFPKFLDVRQNKFNSQYKDWFHVHQGNSYYDDGFYYECWEGHQELVKLNIYNPQVRSYLKNCINEWVKQYDIDGIRFDVAYCLDVNFLNEICGYCRSIKDDFWLMGETLHGDYNKWMNAQALDSVTNYECYKGLFSSFNERNMFEIAYSLNRQFGAEHWTLYKGKHLYTFVDNHDVNRIASQIKFEEHLPLIYTLLFAMPGIPSVYYGSEFAYKGMKTSGDDRAVRAKFDIKKGLDEDKNNLHEFISTLAKVYNENKELCYGNYKQIHLTNRQFSFIREYNSSYIICAINCDDFESNVKVNANGGHIDLLTGEKYNLDGNILLKKNSAVLLRKI